MQVLLLMGVLSCVPYGISLSIKTSNTSPEVEEGTPLKIVCSVNDTDVERLGAIAALSIATVVRREVSEYVPQYVGSDLWTRKFTIHTVVTQAVRVESSGQFVWGDGFAERAMVSATTTPTLTSLTLTINTTTCTDGPGIMCMARGQEGTVDSPHTKVNIVPVPQRVLIRGGRRWSRTPRDHCDVYAVSGEKVDFTCTARVGHSLRATPVTWYKYNGGGSQTQESAMFPAQNSTTESCSVIIGSSVLYQHQTSGDAADVTLTCNVPFSTPLEPNEMIKSSSVTVCTDASSYSRDYVIALFFAGAAAMLGLVLLILLVVMCCCGYSCRNTKKNSVNINGDYPGK